MLTCDQKIFALQITDPPFYNKYYKSIPSEIMWVVRPQENFKSTESTEAVSLNSERQL